MRTDVALVDGRVLVLRELVVADLLYAYDATDDRQRMIRFVERATGLTAGEVLALDFDALCGVIARQLVSPPVFTVAEFVVAGRR